MEGQNVEYVGSMGFGTIRRGEQLTSCDEVGEVSNSCCAVQVHAVK